MVGRCNTAPGTAGYVENTRQAAKRAYAEAGVRDPRQDISLTEVHDCFSITELVTMEDLGLSDEGRATATTFSMGGSIATARSRARSTAG